MGQKKGKTGNLNGRPKGTPNKLTADLRERISDFLNGNWEQIENDFKDLEPEKRVLLFEKLLQYTLPRLQNISMPDCRTVNSVPIIVFKDFAQERLTDEERKAKIAELKKKMFEDD